MWWTRSTPSLILTGLTDLLPPSCLSGSDGPVLKYQPVLPTQKFVDVPLKIEIVINELRKIKMSADFFANTSHDICRCPGV
jgi:hypothetical protein